MSFIKLSDYYSLIRDEILEVIVENDHSIRRQAESAAIEEMRSYLTSRYKTDEIFIDVPAFQLNTTYVLGDVVEYEGSFYTPTVNIVPQNYVPPYVYSYTKDYTNGDNVFFTDGQIYECQIISSIGVPPPNMNHWQLIGAGEWTVTADPRNALIKMYLIDLVLYHLHARINPRDTPEQRKDRYKQVIGWLKKVSDGHINPHLPKEDNNDHDFIIFGSNPARNNHY